jgi:hypothetical protein
MLHICDLIHKSPLNLHSPTASHHAIHPHHHARVLERDTPKNYLSNMEEEEEEKWNLLLAPNIYLS